MSLVNCLMVAFGGALGSLARFIVAELALPLSRDLPVGTIAINVVGSFVIGLYGALTLAQGRYPASETLRLFVMVGVCGGFTTFSSFSLQTFDLLRAGAFVRAGVNVVASVLLCLGAVAAGFAAGAHFNAGADKVAQLPIEEEA